MSDWIIVGRITGLYGVHGWVRVFSYTQPREGIGDYRPLYLQSGGDWRPIDVQEVRLHGGGILFKLDGYADRTAATRLLGCDLAIRREQLPPLGTDEYYWVDLKGLRVLTVAGVELGRVERLFETGANDVVVVVGERERLIPFIRGDVIKRIDLAQGLMEVDWDPEF
ncbi:MAG: ribosome maturation factor RimM [Candidatus Competibacteraceae bacterium]